MSHFTVSLIIPGAEENELEDRVDKMLLPYMEEGAGKLPREYLEFHDMEEEYLGEYQTETVARVRVEDGTTVWPWDKRFEVKDEVLPFCTKTVIPEHLQKVELPFREIYRSFDEFCRDYHGSKRDPEKARYGYWHNPNGKWDWYQIGGRWAGLLRTRDGVDLDYARFSELDLEWAAAKEREERQTFLKQLGAFCARGMKNEEGNTPFDGVRSTLLTLGILECADANEIPALEAKHGPIPEKRRSLWSRQLRPGMDRFDVLVVDPEIVDESWLGKHDGGHFFPFRTYGFVDERGWTEPGKMGWWAATDATPESRVEYGRAYRERFQRALEETPDAFLVVVDCHV